ncbi:MAG: hypothetical protein HN855_11555 [Anaerolineae bacterium]|jgi:hypothetical protein|nr:hypothetical protein [Anaerolineae bacterium]MBT7070104.1 hypothetical protein [Anaerolineae bacterium]MBT7325788.1 hypothetical protein [Anaerolineae bacterium]
MRIKTLSILIALSLLLTACNVPASMTGASSGTLVIMSPLDGTHLNVGDTVDILSQMSLPSDTTSAMLIVNDAMYRQDDLNNPISAGSLYQPWAPTEPGTYTISVRVSSADGELASNTITVIVGEVDAATLPPPTDAAPTETLLPNVTATATVFVPSATPLPAATDVPTVTAVPPTATTVVLANSLVSGKVFRDENGSGSLNPADTPISGVSVLLGSGACPSSGLQITQTGGDGSYTFPSLAAGQYCVTVDTSSLPNIGGTWQSSLSNPLGVSLGVSESLAGKNFMFQPIIQ